MYQLVKGAVVVVW